MCPKTIQPSKENTRKEKASSAATFSSGTGFISPIKEYFRGVKYEFKHISWPSRPQVIAETLLVIVVVAMFSAIISVIDVTFKLLISWIT